jgi:hypothetical protein
MKHDPSYSVELLRKVLSSETPQSMNEWAQLFYVAVYQSEAGILGVVGLDMNEIRFSGFSTERNRSYPF